MKPKASPENIEFARKEKQFYKNIGYEFDINLSGEETGKKYLKCVEQYKIIHGKNPEWPQ